MLKLIGVSLAVGLVFSRFSLAAAVRRKDKRAIHRIRRLRGVLAMLVGMAFLMAGSSQLWIILIAIGALQALAPDSVMKYYEEYIGYRS